MLLHLSCGCLVCCLLPRSCYVENRVFKANFTALLEVLVPARLLTRSPCRGGSLRSCSPVVTRLWRTLTAGPWAVFWERRLWKRQLCDVCAPYLRSSFQVLGRGDGVSEPASPRAPRHPLHPDVPLSLWQGWLAHGPSFPLTHPRWSQPGSC